MDIYADYAAIIAGVERETGVAMTATRKTDSSPVLMNEVTLGDWQFTASTDGIMLTAVAENTATGEKADCWIGRDGVKVPEMVDFLSRHVSVAMESSAPKLH